MTGWQIERRISVGTIVGITVNTILITGFLSVLIYRLGDVELDLKAHEKLAIHAAAGERMVRIETIHLNMLQQITELKNEFRSHNRLQRRELVEIMRLELQRAARKR